MFKRAIPPATQRQQFRQDLARGIGCIACWMEILGLGATPTGPRAKYYWFHGAEIHHQTSCGRQLGQDETVCLCLWHHRAQLLIGMVSSALTLELGPSLAKGSKPFFEAYGTNDQQLDFQNWLIDGKATRMGIPREKWAA